MAAQAYLAVVGALRGVDVDFVHSAPPHKIAIPQTASAHMVVAVPMIAKARK
jgi:hypothetical protein